MVELVDILVEVQLTDWKKMIGNKVLEKLLTLVLIVVDCIIEKPLVSTKYNWLYQLLQKYTYICYFLAWKVF